MAMKGAEGIPITIVVAIIIVVVVAALVFMFVTSTSNNLNIAAEGVVGGLAKSICGIFGPAQTSVCPNTR
jgi:uncharacterized membrane protein